MAGLLKLRSTKLNGWYTFALTISHRVKMELKKEEMKKQRKFLLKCRRLSKVEEKARGSDT